MEGTSQTASIETRSKPSRWPLLLSSLFFLSQVHPAPSPVLDATTLIAAPGYRLAFPLWHIIFTPFCSIADYVTILSLRQAEIALIWVIVGAFCLVPWRKVILFIVGFLVFLAWGALIPRPMGALIAPDSDTLLIDFHSHSRVSHDGRPSFTAEANKKWHWRQGYNAAFITDHNKIDSALEAKNSSSGDWRITGYRSLMGEEISLYKTHLVVLGNAERIDNQPYDSDPQKVWQFISDMRMRGIPVVASLPEYWWYHWRDDLSKYIGAGISGFEIVNSAPKAMDFPIDKRMHVIDLCRSHNLFVTGISDNHGYGYATAVWNAMKIPGWSNMPPAVLEVAVLKNLKAYGFNAVRVLERTKYEPRTMLGLVFSPLMNAGLYWCSLQPFQVLSWVGWVWFVFGFAVWRRKCVRLDSQKH